MSGVNIAGMAELVRLHGCALRPVDLDPATLAPDPEALRAAAADGAALVVFAHLYGRRAPLDPRRSAPGLVVEDCAQAFDGALRLSPGADVALFSFGPIKAATALGGGVALFRDPALAGRIARRVAVHPPLDDGWFLRRALKYAVFKVASAPLLYGAVLRLIALTGRDPDAALGGAARGFPGALPEAIRHGPPPRLLRLMARRLERWREPAPGAARAARDLAVLLPVPGLSADGRWWLLPVRHNRPADLVRTLRRQGLDATRGATSLRALTDAEGFAHREASRLTDEVVYLPLPASPSQGDRLVRRLARALKDLE